MPTYRFEEVTDQTPPEDTFQWVVRDPVQGYLIAGTGYSRCRIYDNRSGSWVERANPNTGENLYAVLHPREVQGEHPGHRRIYLACENNGDWGYYDPVDDSWNVLGTVADHLCGTSIGYRPSVDAVYFGYVQCNLASFDTKIQKYVIGSGATSGDVGTVVGKWTNGPWVLASDGKLYNSGHDGDAGRVHIVRQDGDNSYASVGDWAIGEDGAHWSHACFLDEIYYSEYGGGASAYRVTLGGSRTALPLGTAHSFTFFVSDDGTELFVFQTDTGGRIRVYRSLDGATFEELTDQTSSGRYGITGSQATQETPALPVKRLVWAHGGKTIATEAIISRVIRRSAGVQIL